MSQSAKHLYIHQNDPVEVARQLAAKWQTTAVERDRAGGSATAEREALRASGLLSLQIPKEYGGWGADWPTTIEVIREIAKVDASLGHLFGYHIATAPMIELVGSPEQKTGCTANWYRTTGGLAMPPVKTTAMYWIGESAPRRPGMVAICSTAPSISAAAPRVRICCLSSA